jgi:hypothetical protein
MLSNITSPPAKTEAVSTLRAEFLAPLKVILPSIDPLGLDIIILFISYHHLYNNCRLTSIADKILWRLLFSINIISYQRILLSVPNVKKRFIASPKTKHQCIMVMNANPAAVT